MKVPVGPEEPALLDALRRGDEDAFARLVNEHYATLRRDLADDTAMTLQPLRFVLAVLACAFRKPVRPPTLDSTPSRATCSPCSTSSSQSSSRFSRCSAPTRTSFWRTCLSATSSWC